MGHLVAMDGSDDEFALSRWSQQLWEEWLPLQPDSVEHLRCGTLWVAADAEEMSAVHQKHAYYAARGVLSGILDHLQLAQAEPQLRRGLAGGLLVPFDSVVYAPVAARWLLGRSGAALLRGRAVSASGSAVRLDDGTVLDAGLVVNATGARAACLTPGVPVVPRKGHLVITDRYPGFLRHQLVELGYVKNAHATEGQSVAMNAQPRRTGQILIGSSRQHGAADSPIDNDILARMLRRTAEYLPAAAELNAIRCWTGLRAATPDGLPMIGPWPATPGLWLATGHEGLGITLAPATARLLAALVLGRPPAVAADPFLPARFCHA
jgi:glycine/D-amino acid oxidase-like deaminating enzyme